MGCVTYSDRLLLGLIATLGGIGVVAGALGAHPPEGFFPSNESRGAWNTGVIFLLLHVLVVLAVGDLRDRSLEGFRVAALLFLLGAVLFSGSIFALTMGAPGVFGPVTPIGGTLLIAGWIALAYRLIR